MIGTCTFNLAEITSVKTDDVRFLLDEADMTIVLVWSECDPHTYLVMTQLCLSYFKSLLYWVNQADMQCKVQMECVLDINVTCPDFGQKCMQLPGMLTLSHCDTTSYSYGKGNATALNMISGNYLGVNTLSGVGTTHTELMNASMPFFVALYGQPPEISMESPP